MQNKTKILTIALLVAIVLVSAFSLPAFSQTQNTSNQIKNVIVLVPDGCSQSDETIARWFKGTSLNVDGITSGTVETWMANSVITDSAPASTAFATGHKSTNGFISVGPRTSDLLTGFTPDVAPYVPLATVLEGAKLDGKATGLVATSTISHATPAGYAAHNYNRNDENDIIEQMVYNDIDVVFGGAGEKLFPTGTNYTTSYGAKWAGTRTDGENLYNALISKGYKFVDSRDGMLSLISGKAWGMFAANSMQADIDRAMFAPTEPSLAEMTAQAIQILSKDKDGFFLMVEGSQVDWANHANDPIYSVTDFLAFDNAVGVALNYAMTDKHTLVMAFPDHNTGGLTLGSTYTDMNGIRHGYTATTVEDVVSPLRGMQITSTGLAKLVAGKTDVQMRDIINQYWNLSLTLTDIAAIKAIQAGNATLQQAGNTTLVIPETPVSIDYAISEYVSMKYTVFGWATHGHTGDDVPLWAWAPNGNAPAGHYDNTQLAQIVADTLGFSLDDAQNTLYVNVADAFPANQWQMNSGDSKNLVLQINVNGKIAQLPQSKDVMTVYGAATKTYSLEGLVVYSSQINAWFIPADVVSILNS